MPGFDPWVGRIPWRRAWQPTPIFLPGESPWTEEPGRLQSMGCKELDTTERQSTPQHFRVLLLMHTIKIWKLRILLYQVTGIENFGHESPWFLRCPGLTVLLSWCVCVCVCVCMCVCVCVCVSECIGSGGTYVWPNELSHKKELQKNRKENKYLGQNHSD